MEAILEIDALTKVYSGKVRAVDRLSLSLEKGTVYGLLGPNGSGKTTTLGILLDIIRPTSGTFRWFGQAPSHHLRKRLGAILETPNFYPYLSARDNLRLVADIRGVGHDRIHQQLEMVGLAERAHHKFKTYSLGMKQRLSLASATLHDPEVLILDEPTNGLDPQGIAEVRDLIQKIAAQGTTILLASHLLDEVQKVCTHVAVLSQGKPVFSGPVAQVLGDQVVIEAAADDLEGLSAVAQSFGGTQNVVRTGNRLQVEMEGDHSPTAFNAHCIQNGITLSHLALVKQSLEEKVLQLLSPTE